MSKQNSFHFDEWVGNARPDPKNADALVLMQGFIGNSSEDGHVRIYADESLNTFVEVPQEGIVHSERLPKESSPLGGSMLWVKADAVLVYGDPKATNRPKASFLEGTIMQQYAAAGYAAGQLQAAAAAPLTPACGTPNCHTRRGRTCFFCTELCHTNYCPTKILCTGYFCANRGLAATVPTHIHDSICPGYCMTLNLHVNTCRADCGGPGGGHHGTNTGGIPSGIQLTCFGGGCSLQCGHSVFDICGLAQPGFTNPGYYGTFNPYETPMGM